ncbi:MAG: TonB-dependent receptor [Bacteroidales bacterium]
MKKKIVVFWMLSSVIINAQTIIYGTVKDVNGIPLVGANIYIKGTIDGATSNTEGIFLFDTDATGSRLLEASFVGYETFIQPINIAGDSICINIQLNELSDYIESVTVTAGRFEASDSKKSILLKPIDIVTVAGSVGDVTGALSTLPGAQRSANDGFLIVRGGDAGETKTFIDGASVEKPYTSHMPDIPARSRFSPMLFKGTMFSTGGFSAQYGQALSSVIQLETADMPEKNQITLSLMSVGIGASLGYKTSNVSVASEGTYANMMPYYSLTGSNVKWTNNPYFLSNVTNVRVKTGKYGMFKSMIQVSKTKNGMLYNNINSDDTDTVTITSCNIYINNSYKTTISKNVITLVHSGIMTDTENLGIGQIDLQTKVRTWSLGTQFKYITSTNSVLVGAEIVSKSYNQNISLPSYNGDIQIHFTQPILSGYIEYEKTYFKTFIIKHGYRYEYSAQNQEGTFSPRITCAYKINSVSQVSLAVGEYRQLQNDDYVKFNKELRSAKAIHYIANYQIKKNDRMIRLEVYHKYYSQLIRYESLNNANPKSYNTNGYGMANGIDLFFRDTKTIRNGDFWVSYSLISTKRYYKDYQKLTQPDYVYPHWASVVYKQFIPKLNTQFGATYTFSTGKRYNNPNEQTFMTSKLPSSNDVCLSFSYLTRILKLPVIIHGSVSNLLGIEQVYGYRFSSKPNNDGRFNSQPLLPVAKRMYFLGIFLSI